VAKCDEGYRCDVCGRDVETIVESALYLRYVLGDVPLETLHRHPERHLRCDPGLAQYVVADDFTPVADDGPFAKAGLDARFVIEEERRVTRGWRRLTTIPTLGVSVAEYPLHVSRANGRRPPWGDGRGPLTSLSL
jgi:hypothetical protein